MFQSTLCDGVQEGDYLAIDCALAYEDVALWIDRAGLNARVDLILEARDARESLEFWFHIDMHSIREELEVWKRFPGGRAVVRVFQDGQTYYVGRDSEGVLRRVPRPLAVQ